MKGDVRVSNIATASVHRLHSYVTKLTLPWRVIAVISKPFKALGVSNVVRVLLDALDQDRFVGFHLLGEESRDNHLGADHEPDLFLDGALKHSTNNVYCQYRKLLTLALILFTCVYTGLTRSRAPPPMFLLAKSSCRAPWGAVSRPLMASTTTLDSLNVS